VCWNIGSHFLLAVNHAGAARVPNRVSAGLLTPLLVTIPPVHRLLGSQPRRMGVSEIKEAINIVDTVFPFPTNQLYRFPQSIPFGVRTALLCIPTCIPKPQ